MRLVHLSDIHFGGYGHGWDPNEDQRRELLNDLGRFVDEKGPVDGVIVGGDIAYHGRQEEYEVAARWHSHWGQATRSYSWTMPPRTSRRVIAPPSGALTGWGIGWASCRPRCGLAWL